MAPGKVETSKGISGMVTRMKAKSKNETGTALKRKAEVILAEPKKRSAFGDITNASNKFAVPKKAAGKKEKVEKPQVVQKKEETQTKPEPAVEAKHEASTSLTRIRIERPAVPAGVEDFDAECMLDPSSVPYYAQDIFNYFREREEQFQVSRYLSNQPELTADMRAVLVDWLVEVQENFELNHETLYMAVKMVDLYLSKQTIRKEAFQLVGTAALLIAAKFEERCPPVIDDFLYVCDDAYTRKELLRMEITMMKTLGFELSFPLSYSFLRRYARVAKVDMKTLTLARYILELSLMDYDLSEYKDSLLAAAAFLLALQMCNLGGWTPTLEYYSGYTKDDLFDLVHRLAALVGKKRANVKTIDNKYSHEVFFEVAKIPLPDLSLMRL